MSWLALHGGSEIFDGSISACSEIFVYKNDGTDMTIWYIHDCRCAAARAAAANTPIVSHRPHLYDKPSWRFRGRRADKLQP